ncbi:carboxypeptidase O-like [Cynara cardunculus var. scolymus]|uniref:carboxypeptidase O-like n=1 Tax=Cynara cardunculus var. scolymus TaxID=59895 RepID=UPI000D628575|nr:carboxypeptidase O-like [Cynara cardunculus var. scolymus]
MAFFRHRRRRFMILPCLLLLIACFSIADCISSVDYASRKQQHPITPINRDLYHTSGTLMEEIEQLVNRHQDRFHIETYTSKNKGYQAELDVVTYRQNRNEIEDNSKFRILLSFGQHARELITTELALKILSILSGEQSLPKRNPVLLNRTLQNTVIKVVPIENLNGRRKVEAGELCERRNGRGVDLNRNWSVDWGKKEEDFRPDEENPGTGPFSEPESQMMRKLSTSFEPHLWVNVHSGMEALFMPYDHKNTTPKGVQSGKMKLILETLNHLHCGDRCVVGSGGGSVGYLAHGTTTDYMFDIAKIPMAFTFEIYGDEKADINDCFKMFNPVDHPTFNRVLDEWSAAFFTMFEMGAHQMNFLQESPFNVGNLISIDDYLNGYLMERKSRYGEKKELLDLGLQEIRTYFRLFLLSSVLLLFMFCSRITKTNRSLVSSVSL